MEERRRFERHQLSGKVHVERETNSGGVATMSVFIREISVGGFSGTYVGPTAPCRGDTLKLRHSDGRSSPVKLVWCRKTLECIHLVGFEVLDSGPVVAS